MSVKHVRLFPTGNTTIVGFTTLGGKEVSKAWEELAAQESAYEGSGKTPSSSLGITSATKGSGAAFRVFDYVLAANEKILTAVARFYVKQGTTEILELSAGGASREGHTITEKSVKLVGTGTGWTSVSYTAADVELMNKYPPMLAQLLEDGALDAHMAKAKEAVVYSAYLDLEIEYTSITVYTDTGAGTASTSATATEYLAFEDQISGSATPAPSASESIGLADQGHGTALTSGSSTSTHTFADRVSSAATATGVAADRLSYIDSVSAGATAQSEPLEHLIYTDSANGTGASSGSSVERWRIATAVGADISLTSTGGVDIELCSTAAVVIELVSTAETDMSLETT